jgi:ligand-binding sensor domain-containing protein/AraC-like DNA-binding protein
LPVNAVHRIYQDREGYMWYGTIGGLCRDDGYNVCVFRSDLNTPNRLDNNVILCISEDVHGRLWFGTQKGVYILDKHDYSIRPLDAKRLKNIFIYRVESTRDGSMWVSVKGALYRYTSDGAFKKSYPTRVGGKDMFLGGFAQGVDGTIVMTYFSGGVVRYDPVSDSLIPFPGGMRQNNCAAIIADRKAPYFWLMTWGDGIIRFDPRAKTASSMYVYQPMPVTSNGYRDGVMLYAVQDDDGNLWCTTKKDLVAFSVDNRGQLHQRDLSALLPPSNRMLNEIIRDHRGDLWVSAYDQPTFSVEISDNKPVEYALPALRNNMDYNPAIVAVGDAGDGKVWLSQERVGIFLYDLNSNAASFYGDFASTRSLQLGEVKIMARSAHSGEVWVSPEGTRIFYHLGHSGMEIKVQQEGVLNAGPDETIQCIKESGSGKNLWIGTTDAMYSYDLSTGCTRVVSRHTGSVTGIDEMPDGSVWFCTNGHGVFKYVNGGPLVHFQLNHHCTTLALTTDGNVWLGTEQGQLLLLDPHHKSFKDYSNECGLDGNQVNYIINDVFNHLWIVTNPKIIEFNPRNGSHYISVATDGSGLLWRILPTTACRTADGHLFFGGIPGICKATPSLRLEREANPVRARITNVLVDGRSLFFTNTNEVENASKIRLSHDAHNIDIQFSTLDHRYAARIRYAYRMEGVDDDWVYTADGHNSALYNQLPKGTYKFQVRATDENGLWSDTVTEMTVYRAPAFYESWAAYLLYAILLTAAVVYALLLYRRKINNQNNELWEDSKELVRMRDYLNNRPIAATDNDSEQLDKILLDKAAQAVEDHLSVSEFDVSALAAAMNMSRSTLTRKLKAITGGTPLEFIRKIKMRHAYKMLEAGSKSITEIATAVGYSDRKYFTDCFKAEFDTTPGKVQKKQS